MRGRIVGYLTLCVKFVVLSKKSHILMQILGLRTKDKKNCLLRYYRLENAYD